MNKKKASIFVTQQLPDEVEARMRELFDVHFSGTTNAPSREVLEEAVKTYDILVPTVTDKIDTSLIEMAGPQLKMIASFGTGHDHIDITAAHNKGIIVTSTPGVTTDDTADMAMALILAVPRRLAEGAALMQSGYWPGWSPTWMLGRRLKGKKLGIVGMGRIGQAVAKRARGFGLSIHYNSRRPIAAEVEKELGATFWDSLDRMLAHMDIISVNCPYTPATFHLLSKRTLGLIQPHAYIVNTSRGQVIDQDALIERLEQGEIAGAALDVLESEPGIDPRFLKLVRDHKAVLIPHLASATLEGRFDMGEKVIINIQTYIDNHRPPDRVLPPQFEMINQTTQNGDEDYE
ncbi:MAG: D-glycerate dehydrogenase [Hyphomicrobiales bacterium]